MADASPWIIRRARSEDIESIVKLWREMWDFHAPLDPRFEVTAAADFVMGKWIEESLASERSALFVAEAAPGSIAGYCHAMILENPPITPWQFYGYVSEISVRPRREGLGARLLDAAHAWLREKGMPYVEVNVSVRNAVARSFWRRRGYSEFLERLRYEL